MPTIGWLDSDTFDQHDAGYGHPERPERLRAVRDGIAAAGLDTKLEQRTAPLVGREVLTQIHDPSYVARLEEVCLRGGGQLDPDTGVVAESFEAAMRAAGAVTHAVEQVLAGTWKRAFCSVRPPGHHAVRERAMGFCLFDNVAVGAQAALNSRKAARVAILDWDVHHGNGTQDLFWTRNDVMYASTHQFPFYPGSGAADEIGAGAGRGTTVNCPLPGGAGDAELLAAWEERIRPAFDAYRPDLVLISAGFDADRRDPLGGLTVSARGFTELSERVVRWSDASCGGRVVSVLEGGYSLEALSEDVALHVGTLFI
jgi:acetoin utilization deacetylase AcuC-like enzyme